MKITKYEHACLDITQGETRVIIDPGTFSKSLTDYNAIDAVVVTHVHADHFDTATLQTIVELNPTVRILTTHQVIQEFKSNAELARPGDTLTIGDITLEFFGENHFLFTDIQNISVLVNNTLYYPGDSYTLPNKPVPLLAMPASAPWFRIDEGNNFLKAIKPKQVFPTHNAPLSEIGESIHYRLLGGTCAEIGCEWSLLKPGNSIEA